MTLQNYYLKKERKKQYKKNINSNITLTNYYDSEYEQVNGYNWQEDYIEITRTDEELVEAISIKDEEKIDYLGAILYGNTEDIDKITGRFQLWTLE